MILVDYMTRLLMILGLFSEMGQHSNVVLFFKYVLVHALFIFTRFLLEQQCVLYYVIGYLRVVGTKN